MSISCIHMLVLLNEGRTVLGMEPQLRQLEKHVGRGTSQFVLRQELPSSVCIEVSGKSLMPKCSDSDGSG